MNTHIGLHKCKLWRDDRVGKGRVRFSRILFARQSVSFPSFPHRIREYERPAAVFRRFYACFSGPTGNLVELNNSARPINVTTRSAVSRKIREREKKKKREKENLEVDGGTPGTLTFYFTVTCQKVYTYLRLKSPGPSEDTPLRSCVVYRGSSNYYQQFPPRFLRQS